LCRWFWAHFLFAVVCVLLAQTLFSGVLVYIYLYLYISGFSFFSVNGGSKNTLKTLVLAALRLCWVLITQSHSQENYLTTIRRTRQAVKEKKRSGVVAT
jgi:hypothetical protein